MGNLMVSLRNASSALRVFERGMGVVQANVSNASTPGYAKQRQGLEAMRVDLDRGLAGGVQSTGTLDSRSAYMDNTVRQRMDGWGSADERTEQLSKLEPVLDISSDAGLMASMNGLMQAASAAAVSPNDRAAREVVLERADALARGFHAASDGLAAVQASSEVSLANGVVKVNELVSRVVEVNREMRADYTAQRDAGLQAKLHNALEDLSELVDTAVLYAEDGSASVYLGGQSLLVIGGESYPLQADTAGHQSRVLGADGTDLSGQIGSGRLEALLDLNNSVLPGHMADLNRLAESVADSVNATLAGGVDRNGQAPAQGLFAYTAGLGSARTLQVTTLTADELALAAPAAPGGNAVALQLEKLFQGKNIDGVTFSQFYGNMAAAAGRQLAGARESLGAQEQLVSQAKEMRDEVQKVSLDEEAVVLMEFQRAYQASAQLIQTLNQITETTINMIR
ncbi:MAG: flagellar hook-associated protein FlgK [Bryobacterales bacterium]|nr:flagellar hook-associated protein FlgK [Bryobacterales bacterium]